MRPLGAVLVFGAILVAQDDGAARWKQRVIDTEWPQRTEIVTHHARQLDAIVEGLTTVAGTESYGPTARNAAARALGCAGTQHAIETCLANLTVRIENPIKLTDDAEARDQPCMHALSQMDWRVVPYVWKYLRHGPLEEAQAHAVAYVLHQVCGPHARMVLQARDETDSETARRNAAAVERTIRRRFLNR